jgi:hypothetical protein
MLATTKRRKWTVCLAAAAMAISSMAVAHHSHNAYEITVWKTIEGTVSEVHIMNPHSWIYVNVTDDSGETTLWALEAANPAQIRENGVETNFVQEGDRIRARIHTLRDGGNGGLLGFITPLHGDPARGAGVEREWD